MNLFQAVKPNDSAECPRPVLPRQGTDVDLDAYSAFAVPLTEQDAGSDPAHSTLARLINGTVCDHRLGLPPH